MGFINHKGVPLDMARQVAEGLRIRYIERAAGIVHRKPTVKRGYAAAPGTGPEGQTCKTCQFKVSSDGRSAKHFLKCELRRSTWTNGEGTDILARSPACSKWESKT